MMDEKARLQNLEDYSVLDSLPEQEFDDIVEIASAVCNAPISLITLLDSQRQWFKAKIGFEKQETPIEQAFCYYAIQNPEQVMVVSDSWQDKRFDGNPLAHGQNPVRFYAGAPLLTREGYALGTLCVIDNVPRQFTPEQERILKILAERVIKQLELRRENIRHQRLAAAATLRHEITLQRLLEAQQLAQIGSWDWDLTNNNLYWSPELFRLFGLDAKTHPEISFELWQSMVHPADLPLVRETMRTALKSGVSGIVEYRIIRSNGETLWLLGGGKISKDQHGGDLHLIGTALDITNRKNAEEAKLQYLATMEEMLFTISHKFRKPIVNIFALINVMNGGPLTEQKIKEYLPYFQSFATELDSYIREVNDFLQESQIRISDR